MGPLRAVPVLRVLGWGPGLQLTTLGLLMFATFWPAIV